VSIQQHQFQPVLEKLKIPGLEKYQMDESFFYLTQKDSLRQFSSLEYIVGRH